MGNIRYILASDLILFDASYKLYNGRQDCVALAVSIKAVLNSTFKNDSP